MSPGVTPRRHATLLAALLIAALGVACAGRGPDAGPPEPSFAELVARLSEPGGYFDTDNLISNERSYLHVVSALRELGVRGGAYVGVGPDQNFSYIAEIRPEIAFIVDIRRDNLLHHLLLKALFHEARDRLEYLCLLHGRALPPDADTWAGAPLDSIVRYLDATPPTPASISWARGRVAEAVRRFGVPLDDGDLATISRFHRAFIDGGLDLQFHSHRRGPRFYYPTYRELLLERDAGERRASYLATEERFRAVQALQREDRIVPVVGDLAGDRALRAIGEHLERRGLRVRAFYTSNVEFYLFREGSYRSFVRNLRALPTDDRTVIIRSVFHGPRGPHPRAVPGYYSTQLLQRARTLIARWEAGSYRSYWDVVTRDVLTAGVAPGPGRARRRAPSTP